MHRVNDKLKDFVYNYVKPYYDKTEAGHNMPHIEYVVARSIKFADQVFENSNGNEKVNYNMVYTIAMFHDTGHHIDRKTHEKLSAQILLNCQELKNFFNDDQIKTMAEAVEDHRASMSGEPRSIYGKIVSTADRNNSVEQCLFRSYHHTKKANPTFTEDEILENAYTHLNRKFGYNGYAKFYFVDQEYEKFLTEIRHLLKDKENFKNMQKNYIENLKK